MVQANAKRLAELIGVCRVVELTESALVQVPTVIGWLKPVILLPASVLTGLSTEQLEAILAHELAHIRRHDYLANMFQTVIEIVGFYHPAVWWVSHKIRIERENCCDDIAVRVTGDGVGYAKALTAIEELRGGGHRLAVAASGGSLFDRVRRLLGSDSRQQNSSGRAPALTAILLVISLLAIPATVAITENTQKTNVQVEGEKEQSVNNIPSYSKLKEFIQANYVVRSNLLKNSAGTSEMFFEKTRSWPIEEGRKRGTKKATWTTKWYAKNDKNRYDIIIGPQEKNKLDGVPLLRPERIRAVVYPDRRVCYKVNKNEVVIDKILRPSSNPLHFSQCFDIERLYQFNARYDVPALLAAWEKGNQPEITDDYVEQTRCIKITYDWEKPDSNKRKLLEVWVAPSQAYSLIKAQFLSNSGMESARLRLVEGYDATYEESKEFKGVWLLKEVNIIHNRIPNIGRWVLGDGEKLTVKFGNVEVGVDIPDGVFTLEDLGIPKGTEVYDKRLRKVVGSYYDGAIREDLNSPTTTLGTEQTHTVQVEAEAGWGEGIDDVSGSVISAIDNKATLDSGMTVELLGLTRIPPRDQPSWKPDGSFIEPLFDRIDYEPSADPNSYKFDYYAVAVRLENKPAGHLKLIKWQFDHAKGYPGSANASLGRERLYEKGVHVGTAKFDKESKVESTTLLLGIASGQWQTIASGRHYGVYKSGQDSILVSQAKGSLGPGGVFGEPGVHIGVTYNITDRQFRVVAVDKQGNIHLSKRSGSGGTDNLRFTTGSFRDLERDQLKEYRFEVRPYEWIKFENISLRPGKEAATVAEERAQTKNQEIEKWLGQGQTRSIREKILVLRRTNHIHSHSKPQIAVLTTMRELVETGGPAVPELVAELKRSNRGMTKRLISFVLRAIDDKRAVDGLIEALGKSRYNGGLGVYIRDDELAKFMLDNQYYPTDDENRKSHALVLGCPVIEITTALEKITGHSEGHDHWKPDGSRRGVQQAVRDAAHQWEQWWWENKTDFQVEGGEGKPNATGDASNSKTIRFTAVVTNIAKFNPSGSHDTFAVEDDARFILFLQVAVVDPPNPHFKDGSAVDFLIHDPVILFGQEQEQVIGKSYHFVIMEDPKWATREAKRRYTLLSVEPKVTSRIQALVEDYFKHNYRDITDRKTIEWGEPAVDPNGNTSISYKYEMIIWDKDKFLANEIFSFDKDGKFLKVQKVEGFPKSLGSVEIPQEDVSTKEAVQKLVEKFFSRNYRDITARKTIKWGELIRNENENVSIQYKYEATIWETDKVINNEIFTFDKNGKFISVKKVGLKDIKAYKNIDPKEFGITVYKVNRKVSSFPDKVDFSSPESTYVIAARLIAEGNEPGWPEISESSLAAQMRKANFQRRSVDPDKAQKYLNAEVIEVRRKGKYASVIARFPSILPQYDIRSFKKEDNKWLNKGNCGARTLSSARSTVDQGIDYYNTQEQLLSESFDPNQTIDPNYFSTTLSNGVTVELVGVCEHPSEGKQWWKPDGTLLEESPYKTMEVKLTHDEGYSDYEFVLRKNGHPDTRFKAQVPGSRHGTFIYAPIDQNGNKVRDLWVYAVNQPEDKNKTLVRIGATSAQWHNQAVTRNIYEEGVYDLGNQQSVAFGRPYETEGTTAIPVVHNLNKPVVDIRVVAITKDGRLLRGRKSGYGSNILQSSTWTFRSLPLENIKEFQFHTRPYNWVTFKNISLKPNFITDVQVEEEITEDVRSFYGLEFRIVPVSIESGSKQGPLTAELEQEYRNHFKEHGPNRPYFKSNQYIWLPAEEDIKTNTAITGEFEEQKYILVSNKPDEIMLYDGSWHVNSVDRRGNKERAGRIYSVVAGFDEYGTHLFSSLTNNHIGKTLAIIKDNKIIFASEIKQRRYQTRITGDFTKKQAALLMVMFEQYVQVQEERKAHLSDVDRQAWREYTEATEALSKGQDRATLAKTFLTIGSKHPQTTTCQTAIELGQLLESMAKEDEQFEKPEDVQALNQSKQVEYYIYKLRDVTERDMTVPGKIRFLIDYPRIDTHISAIRKMDKDVVPVMIEHLTDRRPTRSVGSLLNGGVVTRNCDVALEIIESIANRKFDFRTRRGAYLSTASEKLRDKIIGDVKQWWQKEQSGTEAENTLGELVGAVL
ncbi:MAG: M56 family metallopeptidase [Planctomycetota bacterium]